MRFFIQLYCFAFTLFFVIIIDMKTRIVLIENIFDILFLERISGIAYMSCKDIIQQNYFIFRISSEGNIFHQNIISDTDIKLKNLWPTKVIKLRETNLIYFPNYKKIKLTYEICDNILKSEIINIFQQFPEYLI